MNHIYRIIWSKTKQCYVVVSEVAKANGKNKSKAIKAAAAVAMATVAATSIAGVANAADATITAAATSPSTAGIAITANGIASIKAQNPGTGDPTNVIYIGNNATPSGIGDEVVFVGNGMTGNSAGHAGDTLIGNRIRSGGGGNDSLATAVGYGAQVSGPSISIGIGSSTDIADSNGPSAVAQGAVAVGSFARASGNGDINGGVAVGTLTSADQKNSTAIGTLAGVTTLGYDREPGGSGGGGALLRLNEANGNTLTSIGAKAGARTTGGIAVGSNATTSRISGDNAIAMGTNSAAVKSGSVAIGNEALGGAYKQSDDFNTLRAQQRNYQNITNTQRTRVLQMVAAANANPNAENKFKLASALGYLDKAQLAVNRATVDITQAVASVESATPQETTNAIAIGNQARAVSTNAMAAGANAIAHGSNSTATGVNAQAMGPGAIASGNGAIAGMTEAAAKTYQEYVTASKAYTAAANTLASATEDYNYTLGNLGAAATTALTSGNVDVNDFSAVAATTDSNLAGLRTAANKVIAAQTALDTARETFNTTRTAANNVASSNNAVAIGTSSLAAASGSVAIGNNAEAPLTGTTNAGVAVGDNSRAADGGTAVGQRAEAFVSNTVAIGVGATAGSKDNYNVKDVNHGYGAIAIGYNTYAKDGGAIAIGSEASGRSANAHGLYAMAIGAGSAVGSFDSTGKLTTPDPGTINQASNNSMAVGYIARVDDAVAAMAMGPNARVNKNATYGVAISNASVGENAVGAVAIGATSSVAGNSDASKAQSARGVALGTRSEVTDGIRTGFNPAAQRKTTSYTGGFADNANTATEKFSDVDIRSNTYAGLTGNVLKSTLAPVSVGSATNTRQINHVAAGYADDDAVNVAQLRSVNLKIAGNTSGKTDDAKNTGYDASTATSKDNVLLDSQTLSVVSSDTSLLTTDATNNTITITPKTSTLTTEQTTGDTPTSTGKIAVPSSDASPTGGLMTAKGVADAINASGFTLTSSAADGGQKVSGTDELINPGDTINMTAGKNMTVTQAANGQITYATKDDVAFNTVALGNQTGPTYTTKDSSGNTVPVYKVGEDADGNPIYNTAVDGSGTTVAPANVTTTTGSNPINMTTKAATPATNNNNGPTNALDITSANGTPTQITGVASTLNTSPVATSPNGTTTAAADQPKLVNLTDSSVNPNSAATVGDLQNMGWVVSSDKTTDTTGAYKDVVKNANEVRFVGTGLANVSGLTGNDGVRTITVNVDAQHTVESAQNPVVYTNAAGDKLTKVGNSFYPATSVVNNGVAYPAGTVIIDGKAYVAGTTEDAVKDGTATAATPAEVVDNGDVIASMNDGDNSSKNTPMALSNVKSNLPSVNDTTKVITNPDGTTVDAADANVTKAPISAGDAANLLSTAGNNAATLSDVLSAGWNLQGNGKAVDFVKPYDTVNFVDGANTKVSVTTTDNLTSNVQVNVTGLPFTYTVPVTDSKGNVTNTPVIKVGDVYYPANTDGTPNTSATPYVQGTDGKYYPANTDGTPNTNVDGVNLGTSAVNPNVVNSADAPVNQTTTATQVTNIAAGANTYAAPVDANGNALKLANDGKWYPTANVDKQGNVTGDNPTAVRPTLPTMESTKGGLIDFSNSNPTNALTVADAQNMGWVVAAQKSVDGTTPEYGDQVRNANEVRFVGADGTSVYGRTTAEGVREIVIDTVKATQPDDAVVYSYTDPNTGKTVRVYPQDVPVYNADGTVAKNSDGTIQTKKGYTTTPFNVQGLKEDITPAEKASIIAASNYPNITTSAKNANGSVTTPTVLNNIANNLPTVTDTAGKEAAADKNGKALTPRTDNSAKNAAQQAPITAEQAADLLNPKRDADGNVANANYVGNRAATVSDVLNAGWNLQGNDKAVDFVKPYDTVNFVDGSSTRVVATVDDAHQVSKVQVNVTGLPITYTDADGDVVAKVGDQFVKVDADGNPTSEVAKGNISTNLVNPNDAGTDSTGSATQLGNVAAGANTIAYDADGNQLVNVDGTYYSPSDVVEGKPVDGAEAKTAVTPNAATQPVEAAKTGLADLTNSDATNALTVADAKNLGWVVEASNTGADGKDATNYAGAVKNTNEVRFNGKDGISVTGRTGDNGEHIIDIALAKGEVVSKDQAGKTGTVTVDGKPVNVVKIGDNWYNASDVEPDANGNNVPKANAKPINTTTTPVTPNTNGSGFVTGEQVGDAIEQSGWNLGKATADTMNKAKGDDLTTDNGKVEKVNPNDNVRYVDGTNIEQNLKTVATTNADGTTHTTTYIQADLKPNVTLGGAAVDKDGNALVKVGDKYYKPADVENGKAKDGATPVEAAKPATNGSLTVKAENGNTGVDVTVTPDGKGQVSIAGPTYTEVQKDKDGNDVTVTKTAKADIFVDRGPAAVDAVKAADGKFYHPADVTVDPTTGAVTANKDAKPVDGEMDRMSYVDSTGAGHDVATMDDGLNFTGDDGQVISKPLNSTVSFTGGNRTTTNADGTTTSAPVAKADTTTGNIGVFNDNGKMSVQLAKDLKGMSSTEYITPGTNGNPGTTTVVNGEGMTIRTVGSTAAPVSVTVDGISAGDKTIQNVKAGVNDTDAVNVSQLRGMGDNILNQANDRIDRVGAQAAALGALKTIQYDPLEPTQFMAGYGYYKGKSAFALGLAHYKNESTLFHAGASMSGSHNDLMANAGVTWKFGSRSDETSVKDTFRQGPISASYTLQDKVSALEAQNTAQKEEINDLRAQLQEVLRRLDNK